MRLSREGQVRRQGSGLGSQRRRAHPHPDSKLRNPAKPQSPLLPSGAKKLCLPGWILSCKIYWFNWVVLCKWKIGPEGILY